MQEIHVQRGRSCHKVVHFDAVKCSWHSQKITYRWLHKINLKMAVKVDINAKLDEKIHDLL